MASRFRTSVGDVPQIFMLLFQGVGLVVCGDDKGSLWLYNMPTMIQVLYRYNCLTYHYL